MPHPAFRGDLRRKLDLDRARSRDIPHLRRLALSCAGSGTLLFAVAALGVGASARSPQADRGPGGIGCSSATVFPRGAKGRGPTGRLSSTVSYKGADPSDPYGSSTFKGKVTPRKCAKGRRVKIEKYGTEKTDARGRSR